MFSEHRKLDDDELLHRQIVPSWRYPDGTPMSQNFAPTRKDDGLLSTRIGGRISPDAAYAGHVAAGFQSAGTWSFTVAETDGRPVLDDGARDGNPEHHASVDFRGISKRQVSRTASIIKQAAVERGATYLPPEDDEADDSVAS